MNSSCFHLSTFFSLLTILILTAVPLVFPQENWIPESSNLIPHLTEVSQLQFFTEVEEE